MLTADAVIIGGGIVGTSIAYNLVKDGFKNVTLIEKEEILGAGSTSKSAGGVRHQYSNEINIRMTIESLKILRNFEEEMETKIDFRRHGYMFLASIQETLSTFKKNVELQNSLGVKVELLSPEEIKDIVPQLNVEDIIGGTFCKLDGYLDPSGLVYGYSKHFKRLGGKIFTSTEAKGIEIKNGKVFSVVTDRGEIRTETVVNAGGPYGGRIGEMAGIKIPVNPLKRQIFVTSPFNHIRPDAPMVIDFDDPFYFRPECGAILMSMADKEEVHGFDTTLDWSTLERVVEKAVHRIPVLGDARVMNGWAGLRELTPDQNAILGEVPGVKGFICAVGFSGHGVMHSPITGKLIAELIIDGKSKTLPISEMSIERFSGGKTALEKGVI
ncbi:MAG: hypothetical protein A2149_09395 [Candidatus Schekmanbacteria bacterium RBG_16_38_11]|uniref:FAD dependent oxidoreductase domain-containing protein n=1 Tax=Candidatus Schekmanbacteria bacterium RBG_16_38_11 TaxID=1817880 RepID=A0A1F7RW84_9BACT|nr:MAG: hypothetical protein A2149_09395 [Candidatus Schekmanbacteria bacterium RBG_16_38_11]